MWIKRPLDFTEFMECIMFRIEGLEIQCDHITKLPKSCAITSVFLNIQETFCFIPVEGKALFQSLCEDSGFSFQHHSMQIFSF